MAQVWGSINYMIVNRRALSFSPFEHDAIDSKPKPAATADVLRFDLDCREFFVVMTDRIFAVTELAYVS